MKTLIEITIQYAGEIITAGVALIIRTIEKKMDQKNKDQKSKRK